MFVILNYGIAYWFSFIFFNPSEALKLRTYFLMPQRFGQSAIGVGGKDFERLKNLRQISSRTAPASQLGQLSAVTPAFSFDDFQLIE